MDKNSSIVQVYFRLVTVYLQSGGKEGKSFSDVPNSLKPYVQLCLDEVAAVDAG